MAVNARHLALLRVQRTLAILRGKRKPMRKRVPIPSWPNAARLEYYTELRHIVADLNRGIEQKLFPQLPRLLAMVEADKPRLDAMHLDAGSDDLKRALLKIIDLINDVVPEERAVLVVRRVGKRVADHGKAELNAQLESSLGVELLHGEPYLQQQLQLFTDDNVKLIKSLASDHLTKVNDMVMRGARAGTRVEVLRDQIADRFNVTERKAMLLARDQVGKLNGELTQLRQRSIGVTRYRWSTSRDERVRARHVELDGTIHDWNDPPIVDVRSGRRGHPGEDIQCRCVAIPMVDDLIDALVGAS